MGLGRGQAADLDDSLEPGLAALLGKVATPHVSKSPLQVLTLAHYDVDRMRKKAPEMMDELEKAIEARSDSG